MTKTQKQQVDDLFISNYGHRISYIWHQNYAAHAGAFDSRFFPELLYIPEFELFQNQNKAAISMLGDKNFLPLIATACGVQMPRTIFSCTNGVLRDENKCIINENNALDLLKKSDSYFVKPSVDSSSGQGCKKCNSRDNVLISRNTLLVDKSKYTNNYVVQELINCHEPIKRLNPSSVNTFRIITYLWHNDIQLMPIIIRIGKSGNYLDNAHAGGIFCAVHEDGTMGKHAVTEFNLRYEEHPDTHIVFANHKIANVDKVIKSAKMHSLIPQIGVVNWDFTIDIFGEPVLIESNVRGGSVWLPQMAHGVGAFGNRTEEVFTLA